MKQKWVWLIVAVLAVALVLTLVNSSITGQVTVRGCVDNDGGEMQFTPSYVTFAGYTFPDECDSPDHLKEAICKDGRADYKIIKCDCKWVGEGRNRRAICAK